MGYKRRRKKIMIAIVLLLAIIAFPFGSDAAVPNTINYQGYLTDADGNPINGTTNILFMIYDADSEGTTLWTEIHTGVLVAEGIFNVILGTSTALPSGFWDYPVYLGITVGGDTEMTPRQELSSVAYAIRAAVAETAITVSPSAIDSSMLADNAITSAKIMDSTITGADIADTTITSTKIAPGAVTSTQIADNTVTAADIADGSGSDLDADVLDGNDSSTFYILSDDEILTGRPTFNGGTTGVNSPFMVGSTERVTNLNADQLDGYHAAEFAADGHGHDMGEFTTGTLDNFRFSAYSDLSSEGFLANASGDLAQNNGALQSTLNADMLDGLHESSFFRLSNSEAVTGRPAFNGGTSGSTSPFTVDSNQVVSNLNADYLDGLSSGSFSLASHNHSATSITSGTLNTSRYSAYSDLSAEGYLGNTTGDVAVNNGTRQYNLNADMLDGISSNDFLRSNLNDTMDGSLTIDGNLTLNNSTNPTRIDIDYDGAAMIDMYPFYYSTYGYSGRIMLYGSDGSWNVSLGEIPWTNQGHGGVYIYDDTSYSQAFMYINSSNQGVVTADIKNFREPNPNDPETDIVYCAIEGPEAAAYVRGTAKLSSGHAAIDLPDYFKAIAVEQGMTVQLTPLSDESMGLAVVQKSLENGVIIHELDNGTGNYEFDFFITAIRKGYENYQVIQPALRIRSPE